MATRLSTALSTPSPSRNAAIRNVCGLLALIVLLTGLLTGQPAAHAQSLGAPEGKVLLTVSGAIAQTNRDGAMVFDRAMLKRLPRTSFTTTTIWTEGVHRFTGVKLADLLDAVAAEGDTLRATALNDYEIKMSLEEARDGALLAYAMDDHAMSVRDKGPLWIVYPYDADTAYQSETIYARSIWQLDRIRIQD